MRLHTAGRPLILWAFTLGCACLLMGPVDRQDPEGRLLLAGLVGMSSALVAPLTGVLWRKLPLWSVLGFVAVVLLAVMELNAWACRASGTRQIHFYDHWYLLPFVVPGLIVLIIARLTRGGECPPVSPED